MTSTEPNRSLPSSEAAGGVENLQPSVEVLAERSHAGCLASFEELVRQFEGRIFQYLLQLTRNQHDAEDLTQVTFLKAFQHIRAYQSRGAFGAWLFTIAKRTALNHFRDSRPTEELSPELPGAAENPSVATAEKESRAVLWEKARSLSPNQYEVLWLRYGQGFSVAETARVMRTNSLRVRVLLHRARAALGKKLKMSDRLE